MRVLVIEDNDDKYERMAEVTACTFLGASIVRGCDLYEAGRLIAEERWDLLLLDMTLDLRRGGAQRPSVAQDYTGGLKIIGQMYYDEIAVPTAIITGFDSFPTARSDGNGVVLGLEAVEREARGRLGGLLLGTVRHGPDGWEDKLRSLLVKFARTRA